MVCLYNNAIVARGILVTILHCGTPEPHLSAIYIVNSVGPSLFVYSQRLMGVSGLRTYAIILPSSDFSVTYGCEGAEDVCDYAAI